LVSQRVQDISQDGAAEWRVQIEDGAAREVRGAGIGLDKVRATQIQGAGAVAGALDIRGLKFDADAASAAANGSQQDDVTEAGAEIDQRVVFGERGSADEIKDMASRSRLIRDHFGIQLDKLGRWLMKLEYAGEQFVEIVIAAANCGIG
jgi:hypothetical protein